MRANQPFRKDEKAEIGIGTMIVFIAAVLVAAIAAGVLIDTSGKLQERSSRTGNEATEQVSGNLQAASILGRRDTKTTPEIWDLDLFLTVAPGAPPMDLEQLRIQINTGTNFKTFSHVDGAPSATAFNVTMVRDPNGSFRNTGSAATDAFVMDSGDLMNVTIALDLANLRLAPRSSVSVTLIPEVGNRIEIGVLTPPSYGVQTRFNLS